MRFEETLAATIRELGATGVESPRAEAELLLASVLGLLEAPRSALYAQAARELTSAQARTLASLLLRRLSGEPVQYVIRRAWFRDLTLEVGPGVLIPRPETEVLAGAVIEWLAAARGVSTAPLVLDLGTGTGCIALAVAAEHPQAMVVASDLSLGALEYARRNLARVGERHPGLAERVSLVAADAFGAFREGERFDVVVSNPPYVGEVELGALAREVREHEPCEALVAPRDGLGALERIIGEAHRFLRPGGLLALEVGDGQADNVGARIAAGSRYGPARIVRDLAGVERVVLAERRSDSAAGAGAAGANADGAGPAGQEPQGPRRHGGA